jgi:hypothetical protein
MAILPGEDRRFYEELKQYFLQVQPFRPNKYTSLTDPGYVRLCISLFASEIKGTGTRKKKKKQPGKKGCLEKKGTCRKYFFIITCDKHPYMVPKITTLETDLLLSFSLSSLLPPLLRTIFVSLAFKTNHVIYEHLPRDVVCIIWY